VPSPHKDGPGGVLAAMMPAGRMRARSGRGCFRSGSWRSLFSGIRIGRTGASTLATLAVASLFLLCASPVAADERPLTIGVLALGPRNLPVWHCAGDEAIQGPTERKRETVPFYVLGLIDELKQLRYVDDRPENAGKPGRHFVIDVRMGTLQELRRFAREFVQRRVDIIVGISTSAVRVAQEETREQPIPILFPGISDPVADGFVQSLAHPGGFITGVSHQQVQGSGKRVELFRDMLPDLRRLITIRRSGYGPAEKSMAEVREAADRLKIDVLDWTITSREQLEAKLETLRHETADGIMIIPDSLVISNMDLVLEASFARRVPTFGIQDFMADWGAVAAYGPSAYQAGGRIARYIDKISKGTKPGDLPVEPTDPVLVVNLKAAACLGINVPIATLHQADRVIR
jgi:putative ABC transport system substrate-binding protein